MTSICVVPPLAPVLLGPMENLQKWLSRWARWWNILNHSQPNPGSPGDGLPCRVLVLRQSDLTCETMAVHWRRGFRDVLKVCPVARAFDRVPSLMQIGVSSAGHYDAAAASGSLLNYETWQVGIPEKCHSVKSVPDTRKQSRRAPSTSPWPPRPTGRRSRRTATR